MCRDGTLQVLPKRDERVSELHITEKNDDNSPE
jgi:hypothetical protein